MFRFFAPASLLLFVFSPARAADVAFKFTEGKNAPVADVVVSLVPLEPERAAKPAPPSAPVDVTQQAKEFMPRVTPVVVGTRVQFSNHDKVPHQIYSVSDPKKFEIPLHRPGTETVIEFDQPGVVAFGCSIHAWMSAYIVVVETPWFALSAAPGAAVVPGVPAGRYRATIWHPRLKTPLERELTVGADNAPPLALALALEPEKRVSRLPDAGGAGYR